MFRIQRCFTWLTIDETYGWVHLCEEKKVEKGSLSKGEGEGEGEAWTPDLQIRNSKCHLLGHTFLQG